MDKLIDEKTDSGGRFRISIPQNTQKLMFLFIGYEWTTVKLDDDCDTAEVVMLESSTYDFMSSKKIDKLRLEQFNKLAELHLPTYKKGLFTKQSICYSREFEPHKTRLDSIEKEDVKIRKQIKLTFERLNVGDTGRIPFSDTGGYRYDGTGRTTLTAYSSFSGGHHYKGYMIKCIVIDKNKRKRAYNIVCKVVNCDRCKDPSVLNGRVIKTGEVFTYNIKYSEIPDE